LKEKIQLLNRAFGHSWHNGEEYLFDCPSCDHHKKKLSINLEKNVFKCWVCDYSGADIIRLLRKHAPITLVSEWRQLTGQIDISRYEDLFSSKKVVQPEALHLPQGFKTLAGPTTPLKEKPLKYLQSRGITDKEILRWKIGFCDYGEYENRIIVPSFDEFGALNYFVGRTYTKNSYKYRNPKVSKDIIFNDLLIDWNSDVVLVEGVFDAIKCDNSIPLLGSSLSEGSKLFEKICLMRPTIYMAMDKDAKKKEYSIMSSLRSFGISTYSIPLGSFNDLAEMTRGEIIDRKCNADIITNTDYLKYKMKFQ